MGRLIRRFVNGVAYVAIPAMGLVVFAHPHHAEGASLLGTSAKPGLAFPWTTQLADQFPGCAEHVPAGEIATELVVRRLNGHDERMGFDEAWRRNHNGKSAAAHVDDVWTEGQCR